MTRKAMHLVKRTLALAVTAVVAAAVGAGGYLALTADRHTPGDQVDPGTVEPTSVIAPAAPPAPTVAPPNPAAAGARPGDVLDVDPGGLPNGLLAYELGDGRHVVVDPAADLPDVVTADLAVAARTQIEAAGTDRTTAALSMQLLDQSVIDTTGRGLVVVYFDPDAPAVDDRGSGGGWLYWARDVQKNATYSGALQPTSDAAFADAQAWVDEHGGPSEHTIVTVTQ